MNTRLSADEMLTALDGCRGLAISQARRFHAKNPALSLRELIECALWAHKHAVLVFDPTRGNKFSTVAHRYAYLALIKFCRVESARGFHVPDDHDPYYAPRPGNFDEEYRHPTTTAAETNEFGSDFWDSVARTLDSRDAAILLRVYRDGLDRTAVAGELKLTKARVGQLVRRAEEKLRNRSDLRELARHVGVAVAVTVAPRRKGRPRKYDRAR